MQIKSISTDLYKLENLKELWIDANEYTEIPEGISKLYKLEILAINDDLKVLPSDISDLENIREIYLPDSLNQILVELLNNEFLEKIGISYYSYSNSIEVNTFLSQIETVQMDIKTKELIKNKKNIRSIIPNVCFVEFAYK